MQEDALDFLVGGGEMGARIRAKDWSVTPLGAPSSWPLSLKTCVRIVLTSRQAMFVWWGESLVNIYNDAYKSIVGGKHPEALGEPASVVWREIWEQIGPRAAQTMRDNEGTYDEALLLIMERNGYPEETYYTFSYSPVPHDDGGVGGIICANTEDTRRIFGERQLALLGDLTARVADARRVDDAAAIAATSLATNPRDLPFALVYLLEADGDGQRLVLAGSSGVPKGHPAAPEVVELGGAEGKRRASGLGGWPFDEVLRRHEAIVVDDLASRFADLPTGAWRRPPKRAVALPIAGAAAGRAGVLVVGLNPFRLFDDDYRGFLTLVAGHLAASIGNAHAYEEEKKRAEALATIDRAKTAFFSNVSHEFRTPLTLMLGPTEDALASEEKRLSGESLRTVHRNALRLLKLVNTLLDFSRLEAGRARASYEPTDLASLTGDLASAFRSAVERARLAFPVDCAELPEPIFVDHDMWEQIVLNLLSNALKFTFEGEISVRLVPRAGGAELTVADTGTGIPERELPHLFERFHRVQGARARTHEGSGIGLALVSELVRLHGGTIDVESRVGYGTSFRVTIPAGTAHLPKERVAATRVGSATSTGAAPFVAEALRWLPGDDAGAIDGLVPTDAGGSERELRVPLDPSTRILLVDDNADMRDYLARLLRKRWTVEAVGDGLVAVESVKAEAPDLVLTDVMMPGLDGVGLMRVLRDDPKTAGIPVIMLSARAGEEARIEGLERGADDYLVKPFSARELVARVTTHLQISRLRKVAETERQKLHEFLMQAPVPVAVLEGPEERFTVANPAFCAMAERGDLVGRTAVEMFSEPVDHPILAVLARVRASGEEARVAEVKVPGSGGSVLRDVYLSVVARPLRDASSTMTGVMLVVLDVTEAVLARRRIEALRVAAEQASRAKDEFLSTLSHELRTPLNAIVGWSSLLLRGTMTPAQLPGALEAIERNARIQARLIEDLLELSRIEQGKLVLNVGPLEMVRVMEAAIDAVRPAADAKGVRLQPVLDSHATIIGDADRLQQVVWNLLTNAIKFTPRGGRVQVRLRRQASHVEIAVADDGQGIVPEFLPYVFDRFRQADASATRKTGGLGLGLSIVRQLVELHGGVVTASSDGTGRGATFVVRLPTAPLRVDMGRSTPSPSPGIPDVPTFECPAELRGLHVLVVDDEPETLSLLEFVIRQCDARVTTAERARDALALLEREPFDVLVSDVGMPEEDGHSFIRKVRMLRSSRGGRIPALALTAYARSEDRTAAFRAGFDMHLAKPIDPAELLVVMARLVSNHQRRTSSPPPDEQDG
ncbi:MAG TPA: ATP-binding protein [Polyangiaceae bacterium]|jgi:PAS domain S-box-containing protein